MGYLFEKNIEGETGAQKYTCTIFWRNGAFLMDEPKSLGGQDLGPDPITTFLASIAGCTLNTLRMYIDRKGWDIPEIKISINLYQNKQGDLETVIDRSVTFAGDVGDEVKERLLLIADKTPISKILSNKITINTKL